MRAFSRSVLVLLVTLLVVGGCERGQSQGAGGAGMPPPPEVTVAAVVPRNLPTAFDYVGRLEASREIEIRPRVSGLIEKRLFEEGGEVKAGETLFLIDPAPFAAQERALAAAVAEARARLTRAEREAVRLKPLAEARAISRKELDDALSDRDLARAGLQSAQARLAEATLNLGYAKVKAPIAGRVGRALQVEGALVSPTTGPLTTLAQVDPIYARFAVAENERLAIERQVEGGTLELPGQGEARVEITLADGSVYPEAGRLNFSDYRAGEQTGAFDARATIPNPQGVLRPGQFVRVKVRGGRRPDAIAVPQRAVQESAQGKFVYVVGRGPQGLPIAMSRPVEVGEWLQEPGPDGRPRGLWVIREGLRPGDRVIVEGTARIFFPGMPISPRPEGAARGAPVKGLPAPAAG